MSTNTYIPLATATLASTAAFIEFTGISGSYTDLVLVGRIIGGVGGNDCLVRINSDTGNNYSQTALYGSGSTLLSVRGTNINYLSGNITSIDTGEINSIMMHFNNYSNTSAFKSVLNQYNSNQAGKYVTTSSGTWRNTAAITTIKVDTGGNGTYAVGTTLSLYGVRAEGISPTTKATGGAVYSDSTYYYHAFGASGTFTPTQSITADVLVVAGGAGGGRSGGGGGAGGYLAFTSQSLTATGYTVTVGSGGAGNNTDGQTGTAGSDSQFGALTLVKGGGGGGSYNANGASGASGGGGGSVESATKTGGSATPSGQGNAGGNGFNGTLSTNRGGGGGGGAGAVGAVATSATGGNGGVGLATYSSWGVTTGVGQNVSGTYYLSGGGGGYGASVGGSGGFGGGGSRGVNGTANTGGGGGGSASDGTTGFSGGSGVVIVRYAK